jgi:putative addiction module CopG family antidote
VSPPLAAFSPATPGERIFDILPWQSYTQAVEIDRRTRMTIRLKPEQEERIAEAIRSGAYESPDEVIQQALEILHERDEWLSANRQAVDAKIRRGIAELDRGEGIPEDQLDAHLKALKAQSE